MFQLCTVLPAGVHKLKVVFTPTDSNGYVPITLEVEILVNPAPGPMDPPFVPTNEPTPIKVDVNSDLTPVLVSKGPGVATVQIVGNQITVIADPKFSGKTSVVAQMLINGELKLVTIPVVAPLVPPLASVSGPVTFGTGNIKWNPSRNAVRYQVKIRGVVVCVTSKTTCEVPFTVGPGTPVEIIALGGDGSTVKVKPVYSIEKPLTALTVYFGTNSYFLNDKAKAELRRVATIIKREGFTRLIVRGHTDVRGGVNNQVLSDNRAKATRSFIMKLLPKVNFVLSGFGPKIPQVRGVSAKAFASNRRAELLVW